MSTAIAALAAIALAAVGVVKGTWAVGGSDSSCYALMATTLAGGHVQLSSTLGDAPWPAAALTLAPGGFIPGPATTGAVPICAPGMSLLMAPLAVADRNAIFWLTPLAAFILVLSAFALARQLAGGMAGATAAVLTATSPIVLYQTVQPMNDILTAALWLLALANGRNPVASGLIVGMAILVRPNLAPLALVFTIMPFLHPNAHSPRVGGPGILRDLPRDHRWRALAVLVAAILPGITVLLWLNDAVYGSAFGSGYGNVWQLFSTSHISANLSNYSRSIWQTQHLLPVAAVAAPFVFDGLRRKAAWVLLTFGAVVIGIYLLYSPFPEWWYLRFLIPAMVVLIVLASAVLARLLTRANMRGLLPISAVVLAVVGTRTAGDRQAFALQQMEGRYRETAQLVRDRLPANVVVITEWQSGGIRFHGGREVVLWASLDPAWLDRALIWLRSKGLQPMLVVERREESSFRARFRAHSAIGRLDWPPRFDLNRQVRIFDPDDRARYEAGETYPTENLRLR
jgi:hypothetical protein